MSDSVSIKINSEFCNGCGQCLRVCPDQAITLQKGQAVASGDKCMQCGHCAAVCPEGAINVQEISSTLNFTSFSEALNWLPWGDYDTGQLVQLMRSRRSCRNYSSKPVERHILEDLVKVGTTAPSGTNSQAWTFTILASRSEVVALGGLVAGFFKKLNKKAENQLLRFVSRLFMKDALGRYYRKYHQTIARGLTEWEQEGKDRLFHGATAVIVVGSTSKASCPSEDALLASAHILLAAHAMGLGTCLIGFAVEAMKRDRGISRALEIPGDETVYSVIALGYPAEKYRTVAGRKPVAPRFTTLS